MPPPRHDPSSSIHSAHWFAPAALVLMTLAAYAPVFRAGFIWDDPDYVTQNATLRSLSGLADIWLKPSATPQYYPLVHTSFWIEYHLWGLSPLGYHLDNVLLHALNAILLWIILRRLRVPGAFLAAAIFAVHPVMVESVAWITERKNVLSLAFYLAATLAYLRWRSLESLDAAAPLCLSPRRLAPASLPQFNLLPQRPRALFLSTPHRPLCLSRGRLAPASPP